MYSEQISSRNPATLESGNHYTSKPMPPDKTSYCSQNSGRRAEKKTWTNSYHNVTTFGELPPMEAKSFPDNSFYSISLHSIAGCFLYADPQTAVTNSIGCKYQRKSLTVQPLPLAIHAIKLPFFSQQTSFWKSVLFHGNQADNCLRPLARRRLITA